MFSLVVISLLFGVRGLELPGYCSSDQYYDPGLMSCQPCFANASLVKAADGFSCSCNNHSVPYNPFRCEPCNVTQVVSSDGAACVARKCQSTSGRVVCRKCPSDYITVTNNFDGSPMKEVQCVKCARGYKSQENKCVRCESCTCTKAQIVVQGICIPKAYVNGRQQYQEKAMHPLELLDVVKHEYLCTNNDIHACRVLADECVKNFYTTDVGGPCRLWLLPSLSPKGLPLLTIPLTNSDNRPGEIILPRGKNTISLALAAFTSNGGFRFYNNTEEDKIPCQLPLEIKIGNAISSECQLNLSKLRLSDLNGTVSPFLYIDGKYKEMPLTIRKPNGYNVQRGSWPTNNFKRYFMSHDSLSTVTNTTNCIYLRTFLIRIRLERNKPGNGSFRLQITLEAQYSVSLEQKETVTTTLRVEHVMPNAGVIRGLEIWGGVLGAFLSLYSVVQWRGVLRRGGLHYTIVPLLAGAVADTLYFAALFSTLHALAAEAGTLGMTLPLSKVEELTIKAFIYSAVGLKALKVAWINWRQCTCDIFFLDWSKYCPPVKELSSDQIESWKVVTLAREWSRLQTLRRAPPGFTVALALVLLHFMSPWQMIVAQSPGYKWAVASIAWWWSYLTVLFSRWIADRLSVSQIAVLTKICTAVGMSLLVFEEECYAHYVHGRNDDTKEARSMAGPLSTCRVACVPQLRTVFLQLSTSGPGSLGDNGPRQELLSRFLAAFFERALDGLNWVASERTIFEKLLNVELTQREAGTTSALLYDDNNTPSCFSVTWWGEEWNLMTLDVMLFSCVLIASGDGLLAASTTILVWQILKQTRARFGNKNQVGKTGVNINF